MKAEEVFSVKVSDPAGLAKLHDGSLLVCNTSTHSVVRCCQKSMTQIKIGPNREFQNPTDVLACSSGEVVIVDARGLHLFDSSLIYVKSLTDERCSGVAEDDEGRIITIQSSHGKPTRILYFDKMEGKIVKIIDLEDIIEAAIAQLKEEPTHRASDDLVSQCKAVFWKMGTIYVTGKILEISPWIIFTREATHQVKS